MGRFGKAIKNRALQRDNILIRPGRIVINITLLLIFSSLLIPAPVKAQGKGKIAVLPFKIESPEPLDHLKNGLQNMLTAYMSEKGYEVISTDVVNENPNSSLPSFESDDIVALGKDLGADWVVYGGLTQVGKKISLDLKVTDINDIKPSFSVYMIEDDIDMLSDAAEKTATSIDNRISGIIKIDKIQVKGNRLLESDAILAMIESAPGDIFDQEKLNSDLQAVYGMGYFTDVTIEDEDGPDGKIVTFNVTEKPVIINIIFEGNEEQKDEKLTEELGIKEYAILNHNEIRQSINRLKDFYKKKGFYDIDIKYRTEELPNNEVSLVYEIDEGKKVYITKIEFLGNEVYDDDELRDLMETSEKSFFSWFTNAGVLEKDKLEYDVYKLTSFYNNNGYINAKLGEPEISYNKEEKGLAITIAVTEGNQYKVNSIKLEGDLVRPESELLSYVKADEEDSFNREAVYTDVDTLKGVYANDGYAYAEVTPLTVEDNENFLVDVTYRINKKKKVRFERINITGNTITRDKVIRRELKTIEGEVFSGTKLDRSTTNLYRLGFFEDIEITNREGSQDDLMILDVKVVEKPTGTFSIGAGYSAWEKAMLMLQITQENLFGRSQTLSIDASLGSRTTEFNLTFAEPWLFDKPLSSSINLYNWETDYDEYTKDSKGGALGLGFPLLGMDEDYTRGSILYTHDDAQVKDIYASSLLIKAMAGRYVTSSVTLGISRDSKDKPWVTTKGSVNAVSFEYAGGFLGGDSYYNKLIGTSTWFLPIWGRSVIMAKGQAAMVDQRSGGSLPIYERFFLGGIDSVRGYEWGDISPMDPETGDPVGGDRMWLYTLEYRYPLLEKEGVTALAFYDMGNSFLKEGSWKKGARRSVGFGIRWYSPMGPLRLEYGFKLDKRPGDSSGEFEFNMGGTF